MSKQRERLLTLRRKDFEIQTFRSGGKGGQHQNKTDSGVRIIHKASGARGESRTERSQHTNKKLAFQRLTQSLEFKLWINATVAEILSGETLEDRVDKQMSPENLQLEIVDEDGRWKIAEDDE